MEKLLEELAYWQAVITDLDLNLGLREYAALTVKEIKAEIANKTI